VRWYIARRVLQMIPVILGATLLIKAMVYIQPGDPIAAMFGDKPVSPAVLTALREKYHLNDGFWTQYWYFMKGLVHFDFGITLTGREVSDVIKETFPVTLKLASMAFVFEAVLGIIFGTISGLRKGKVFDSTMLVLSLLVIAVPIFVFGFILQFLVGVKIGWEWLPPTVGSDTSYNRLLLPAIVLGSVSFAYILRLTRTSVAENVSADHVRTATAKGLSERDVVTRHIMRNSLIPVVTFLGADFGALLAGALVTEGIFNVPGVGYALYDAVRRNDGSTTIALVTLMVIIYVVANLVVDLLYAVLDPRIRYGK
jgi:oligopeptide transport system permease protein